MWFARGTDEPATSMEVRLLSDLSRGLVPKQIASVLVGCRTIPLWRNQLCMITITSGRSRFRDTVRGQWRGVQEGTPSSKARAKGFDGGSPTHLFAKIG